MKNNNIENYKHLANISIESGSNISAIVKKINKNLLGLCFVLKKGILKGVISDGDIRRSLKKRISFESKIDHVVSKKFFSLNINSTFDQIQNAVSRFKVVPLVDRNNKLLDYATPKRLRSIPNAEPNLSGNELKYLIDCFKSGWISSKGNYINKFEKSFKNFTKSNYTLSVSNGTAAIILALKALGIKNNDEVIVPDYSFIAPTNSVISVGAKPVLCEVDKDSLCLDISCLKKLITKKTKAIIAVHLFGNIHNIKEISQLAKKNNIFLIEDSAEAFGSYYKNIHSGTFGDIGTFSFFGNKMITTGEGGMMTFKNSKIYNTAKILRDHGMSIKKKYWHDRVGYNFRLTNLQSSIGLAQLERAKQFMRIKKNIHAFYKKYLLQSKYFVLGDKLKNTESSYWLIYIMLDISFYKYREELIKFLNSRGIDARNGFYSASLMPPYIKYKKSTILKNSREASKTIITLPSSVNLKKSEIKNVCETINIFFEINKKKLENHVLV